MDPFKGEKKERKREREREKERQTDRQRQRERRREIAKKYDRAPAPYLQQRRLEDKHSKFSISRNKNRIPKKCASFFSGGSRREASQCALFVVKCFT